MNTNERTEILLSAAEVADLTGLKADEIRKIEPAYFGVPGHWQMNRHGVVVYTACGIQGLHDVLIADGKRDQAAKLYAKLVELRQERATPSRALMAPAPKSVPVEPYYRSHPTLA